MRRGPIGARRICLGSRLHSTTWNRLDLSGAALADVLAPAAAAIMAHEASDRSRARAPLPQHPRPAIPFRPRSGRDWRPHRRIVQIGGVGKCSQCRKRWLGGGHDDRCRGAGARRWPEPRAAVWPLQHVLRKVKPAPLARTWRKNSLGLRRRAILEKQEKEQAFAQRLQKEQERYIKLNVGGTLYSTSRSTLSKFPDSMLESLGERALPAQADGGRRVLPRPGRRLLRDHPQRDAHRCSTGSRELWRLRRSCRGAPVLPAPVQSTAREGCGRFYPRRADAEPGLWRNPKLHQHALLRARALGFPLRCLSPAAYGSPATLAVASCRGSPSLAPWSQARQE